MKIRLKITSDQLKNLVLPRLFRQLGVAKWLRERAIHVPASSLNEFGEAAEQAAQQLAGPGNTPTPAQRWRAQELVQAAAVNGDIEAGITTLVTGVIKI